MATKGSTYFAQSCVSVVITLLKTVAKFKNGAKFESGANKFSHYQEYIYVDWLKILATDAHPDIPITYLTALLHVRTG